MGEDAEIILLADRLALRILDSGISIRLSPEECATNQILLWLRESSLHSVSNWSDLEHLILKRLQVLMLRKP